MEFNWVSLAYKSEHWILSSFERFEIEIECASKNKLSSEKKFAVFCPILLSIWSSEFVCALESRNYWENREIHWNWAEGSKTLDCLSWIWALRFGGWAYFQRPLFNSLMRDLNFGFSKRTEQHTKMDLSAGQLNCSMESDGWIQRRMDGSERARGMLPVHVLQNKAIWLPDENWSIRPSE